MSTLALSQPAKILMPGRRASPRRLNYIKSLSSYRCRRMGGCLKYSSAQLDLTIVSDARYCYERAKPRTTRRNSTRAQHREYSRMANDDLESAALILVANGKGILAADETTRH